MSKGKLLVKHFAFIQKVVKNGVRIDISSSLLAPPRPSPGRRAREDPPGAQQGPGGLPAAHVRQQRGAGARDRGRESSHRLQLILTLKSRGLLGLGLLYSLLLLLLSVSDQAAGDAAGDERAARQGVRAAGRDGPRAGDHQREAGAGEQGLAAED